MSCSSRRAVLPRRTSSRAQQVVVSSWRQSLVLVAAVVVIMLLLPCCSSNPPLLLLPLPRCRANVPRARAWWDHLVDLCVVHAGTALALKATSQCSQAKVGRAGTTGLLAGSTSRDGEGARALPASAVGTKTPPQH